MNKSKLELEQKIKTHCEIVMASVVAKAGTAARVVNKFVCLPNQDGNCDDMLDLYFERFAIEKAFKTTEFTADLGSLSVGDHGQLHYMLYLDVGDAQDPCGVGHCQVDNFKGEITVAWDYLDLEAA